MKSVQIRSYFWIVFSCIQTEYGDLKCPNTELFLVRIWTLFMQWLYVCSGPGYTSAWWHCWHLSKENKGRSSIANFYCNRVYFCHYIYIGCKSQHHHHHHDIRFNVFSTHAWTVNVFMTFWLITLTDLFLLLHFKSISCSLAKLQPIWNSPPSTMPKPPSILLFKKITKP